MKSTLSALVLVTSLVGTSDGLAESQAEKKDTADLTPGVCVLPPRDRHRCLTQKIARVNELIDKLVRLEQGRDVIISSRLRVSCEASERKCLGIIEKVIDSKIREIEEIIRAALIKNAI